MLQVNYFEEPTASSLASDEGLISDALLSEHGSVGMCACTIFFDNTTFMSFDKHGKMARETDQDITKNDQTKCLKGPGCY